MTGFEVGLNQLEKTGHRQQVEAFFRGLRGEKYV